MNRTAALAVISLAVAAVAAPPALAVPKKKPITKSYDVTAPAPDPSNWAEQSQWSVCAQNVPGSFDKRTIEIPAAGSLHVELSGFTGDWDLLLEDSEDEEISAGSSSDLSNTETADSRFKKAQKVSIVACNWAGSANATVKYTFTYK